MTLRRNVLIFHQAALGDFIVTWPIAVALGRLFPQSRVIYVAPSSKGKLAEIAIGVESTDIESGWHALHSEDCRLPERNEQLLKGAHTIISFVSESRDNWERNVRQIAPDCVLVSLSTKPAIEPQLVADEAVPPVVAGHVTGLLLRQLTPWSTFYSSVLQILRSVVDRGISTRRASDGAVVIHPGAGRREKCWAPERFVELADNLKARGRKVRIVLGEAELELWKPELIRAVERAADVRKPESFVGLFNEIASAGHFVGNDSGPAHLAGIIGVPTVSLFGAPSARWRPIGPRVTVIEKSSLDQIDVDSVLAAVSE